MAECTAHELDKLWDRDSPVEGYIILGLWSFVSLYVACYFRGKSDRNYVPAFLFSNVVIHCLTQDVNQYVEPIPAVWAMAKPMLLGVTLTLILGLILFPTTAMAKVERVNLNALCQILNVLDLTTKSFLLDQSTNNLAVKDLEGHIATVRKTAATLQMAVTEAQLEMSYSHHRPADFAEIPGVIHKVVQHMGSMVLSVKNEKSLLTNSSAKHMSFAKLPTTDQFSYLPVLSPRLDTTLIPSQSLLSSASKGNPSHRHLENCQFLQVLESLRPTILELAYLCELALDQCAFELITSCVTLQNPSTLYHALRSLPQQLLINSQSLLVNKHAATHTKRSTRSWINRLRGWIHCASSSPNAGDPQAPMTLSNPFAGNQQPLPRAPNSHGQSTTDDSMDLERTLTLTQLFHKSPTPSDDSSESLNSGKHSPAPCHHFRPTSKSATGSNLALSNLDEFLTRVYQALDRFDRLDTMSMLRSYHQANQLSSFESLPSINESASTDFSPAGELDSTYLHSMYPADDGEPFMIFFFLFSLRETVLLLVKLLTLMRIFKERQSARRRLWLGFVSHFWRSMTTKAFYQRPCSKSQPVTDPNINYWHANTSTLWPTPAGSSSSNHSSGPCLDTLYPPLGVWARWSSCVQWSRRHVGYWIRHQLRHVQRWYQSPQSRYAVRLSLTLVLLCVPAWHPATIATYQVHKLSWVPLTVCVVSNPTVGQTMMRSIYRITGTLLASVYVIACWYLTGGNVYAIFVCNILWALPCFYVMLFTKYRSVGLIAIIVSLVIPFLASPKASAVHTADALLGKRVWTTLLGITIAGVLSYWWWPQVARVGLRKRVASLVDTLGNLYGLLVAKLAVPPTMNPENHFFRSDPPHALPLTPSFHPTDTPTTFQASGSNQSSLEPFPVIRARHLNQQIAVGMQRAQAMLLQCSGLLDDAQVELSLQGPFPHSLYAQILTKLQNVMSRLVTMEIATNYLSPQLHATIIDPFHQYGRKDLVASLMLNFRTLADSLQNGVPLPPYLPSCQAAHSRLFSHVQAALVQEPDPKHCHHSSLVLDSSQCMGNAPHSDAPFYCESCSPTLWASPASSASNLLDHGETQTECLASPKNHSPCMHTLIPSNRSLKRFYTKYVQPRKKKIKSQRQSISLSGRHANRSQCSFKSVPSLPKVFSSKAGHMLGTFYWMAYSVAMRWVIEELDEVVDLLRQIVGENGLQAYLDPFVDETMPK
ncbi:hypothetical protein H4R35_000621 [Dimargaris xerosporica]|nr:hypothetical protein H4R35_000621 [Dimargaris xerosporica]